MDTPAATFAPCATLSDAERQEVRDLTLIVYPPDEFADWPGWRLEWDTPQWCVRVRDNAGTLRSYVGVYVRSGTHDGKPVRIGGIGNVKTHPEARGRGLASRAIRRAMNHFQQRGDVDFALLVCAVPLLGYYARQGWSAFAGLLHVQQFGVTKEFTLCRVMTQAVASDAPREGTIQLHSPPW